MNEYTLKEQIERTIFGDYSSWAIGLTDDARSRRAQLGHPLDWLQWRVESSRVADKVIRYFRGKGMRFSGNGCLGKEVYIYR